MSTAVGEEKVTWRFLQIKYCLNVQTGVKCYRSAAGLELICCDIKLLSPSIASKDVQTKTQRTTVYYKDQQIYNTHTHTTHTHSTHTTHTRHAHTHHTHTTHTHTHTPRTPIYIYIYCSRSFYYSRLLGLLASITDGLITYA
jgi:hypothetical protein